MLGFMSGCAFLSMWVSNTSAVAMVMPIVEAVIQQILRSEEEADGRRSRAATGVSNLALQLDGGSDKLTDGLLALGHGVVVLDTCLGEMTVFNCVTCRFFVGCTLYL